MPPPPLQLLKTLAKRINRQASPASNWQRHINYQLIMYCSIGTRISQDILGGKCAETLRPQLRAIPGIMTAL